jgi:hypothetical protein
MTMPPRNIRAFAAMLALCSVAADIGLSSRVDQLERTLERLSVEVQGIERRADDALRQASQAQRTAEQATQLARDASRLR